MSSALICSEIKAACVRTVLTADPSLSVPHRVILAGDISYSDLPSPLLGHGRSQNLIGFCERIHGFMEKTGLPNMSGNIIASVNLKSQEFDHFPENKFASN